MNRQPSKEELLRMYQQEANLNRERKALEKQSRQNEERETLDRMNREIETERRNQQNRKAYITNERMTDYKNFMQKKSEETVERRRVTKKNDDNIAGKIGGENRTFKRKNYEETSNNLILNPTREFIGRGRNTESDLGYDPNQPRGKSQAQARGGYNIINHTENNRRENIPSEVQEYIREERGNEQVNPKMHGEVEGIENLENYNPNVEVKPQTSEDEEYIKYYEYMRRKEEEERERMNQGKNQVEENPERAMQVYEEYLRSQQNGPQMEGSYSNDHYQNQNVNYLNRESGYNSNQMNPKYSEASVNEIDNRMQNMNIATESTQNEYLLNKMRNNGSNYNNINHTQANLVPTQYRKEGMNSQKNEQQEQYRNYLNSQIQERGTHGTNLSNGSRVKLTKNMNVTLNPYSTKNYEFGASALSTNPITNPVNSYQFNYNKFRGNNLPGNYSTNDPNREYASARLRNLGSNIINK